MKPVAIVGQGMTKFGENWHQSLKQMAFESNMAALRDAKIERKDIEALFVGNMASGRFTGQEHLGSLVAESLGINVPAANCEAAGAYALMARAHMNKFGTTQEQLAMVAVNNHKNGVSNQYAQFRFPITVEAALNAPMVADPLRLYDCSPITDGSAALILASENAAKKFEAPVWIKAVEQTSDTLALHNRASFFELAAAESAAKKEHKAVKI